MAKRIRWQIPFASISDTKYRIDVYDEGWNGSITQLQAASFPFETSEEFDSNVMLPVRKQTGYLSIVVRQGDNFDVSAFMPKAYHGRYIELVRNPGSNQTVCWRGYIKPEKYSHKMFEHTSTLKFPVLGCIASLEYCELDADYDNVKPTYAAKFIAKLIRLSGISNCDVYLPGNTADPDNEDEITASYLLATQIIQRNWFKTTDDIDSHQDGKVLEQSESPLEMLEDICTYFGWSCHEFNQSIYFTSHGSRQDNTYIHYPTLTDFENISNESTVNISAINVLNETFADTESKEKFLEAYRSVTVKPSTGTDLELISMPDIEEVTNDSNTNGGYKSKYSTLSLVCAHMEINKVNPTVSEKVGYFENPVTHKWTQPVPSKEGESVKPNYQYYGNKEYSLKIVGDFSGDLILQSICPEYIAPGRYAIKLTKCKNDVFEYSHIDVDISVVGIGTIGSLTIPLNVTDGEAVSQESISNRTKTDNYDIDEGYVYFDVTHAACFGYIKVTLKEYEYSSEERIEDIFELADISLKRIYTLDESNKEPTPYKCALGDEYNKDKSISLKLRSPQGYPFGYSQTNAKTITYNDAQQQVIYTPERYLAGLYMMIYRYPVHCLELSLRKTSISNVYGGITGVGITGNNYYIAAVCRKWRDDNIKLKMYGFKYTPWFNTYEELATIKTQLNYLSYGNQREKCMIPGESIVKVGTNSGKFYIDRTFFVTNLQDTIHYPAVGDRWTYEAHSIDNINVMYYGTAIIDEVYLEGEDDNIRRYHIKAHGDVLHKKIFTSPEWMITYTLSLKGTGADNDPYYWHYEADYPIDTKLDITTDYIIVGTAEHQQVFIDSFKQTFNISWQRGTQTGRPISITAYGNKYQGRYQIYEKGEKIYPTNN